MVAQRILVLAAKGVRTVGETRIFVAAGVLGLFILGEVTPHRADSSLDLYRALAAKALPPGSPLDHDHGGAGRTEPLMTALSYVSGAPAPSGIR
jgi:hypothetical protein